MVNKVPTVVFLHKKGMQKLTVGRCCARVSSARLEEGYIRPALRTNRFSVN